MEAVAQAISSFARNSGKLVLSLIGIIVGGGVSGYLVNRFISTTAANQITIGSDVDFGQAFYDSLTTNPLWLDPNYMPEFWIAFALVAVVFTGSIDWDGTKERERALKGKEMGSARWATLDEMKLFASPKFTENILLSQNVKMSIPALKKGNKGIAGKIFKKKAPGDRNKHVMVIGGSGSGKTFNVVGPNLLNAEYSILSTDPKGDTCTKYGEYLKNKGYKIKILNVKDAEGIGQSMRYNPIKYIQSQASIMQLVNIIIENTKGEGKDSGEDFFVKAEKSLYMCLIAFLYYKFAPEQQTIPTMLDLIGLASASEQNENAKSPLDFVMDDYREELIKKYGSATEARRGPEWFVLTQYDGFKKAAGETAKSIIISCFVRLAPFAVSSMRELFSADELELDRLGEEKTAFFLVMSDSDSTFNFVLAMLLYQLFDINVTIADRNKDSHCSIPVMCYLDEIGNIGRIPDLDKKAATLRSRWINLIPIMQTAFDLKKAYGEDESDKIWGNCDTTLFLGRCKYKTNEIISKELGKETIEVESVSYSKKGGNTVSKQKQAHDLMSPEDLGSNPEKFADDECIIMINNCHPYKEKKFMLFDHPNYPEFEAAGSFDAWRYVQEYRADQYRKDLEMQRERQRLQAATNEKYLGLFTGIKELIVS